MAKFLDLNGLSYFKTKLEAWVDSTFLKKVNYEAPTIKVVKVNGSPLSPDGSKAVNIDLGKYAIKADVTKEIAEAVSGITSFDAQVVSSLPQTGKKGVLYLVANSGNGNNVYDEYLWVGTKFEKLGTREIDLSAYAKKSELPTKTSQLENDSGFLTSVPSEYVTDSELTAKGYQTASQVSSAISTATADMATNANVDNKLKSYALKSEIPAVGPITNDEIDGLFTA